MKKLFIIIILLLSNTGFAQREAAIWYFGTGAGLDFNNTAAPPLLLTDGQMDTYEGCATISDATGNLLFYVGAPDTNPNANLRIWNKNHAVMPNGTGLLGSVSATQAAMIVPKPDDTNIYYVFTVGKFGGNEAINYSVVDMTLDGGLGDVVAGQKNLAITGHFSEKITAVKGDGNYYWIIAYGSTAGNFNSIYAFKLDDTGTLSAPVISSAGVLTGDGRGYLKIDATGSKLALANTGNNVLRLFNFDATTGVASGGQNLSIPAGMSPYGLEFSLSGNMLYASLYSGGNYPGPVRIRQYDLSSANASVDIDTNNPNAFPDWGFRSALQMAIDGKIYVTLPNSYTSGTQNMGVVNNPEGVGAACSYNQNAITFPATVTVHQGLPPFIQSFFNVSIVYNNGADVCEGNTVDFSINSNQVLTATDWNFGDGSPVVSGTETPSHIFPVINDGTDHTYTVNLHTEYVGNLGQTESQDFTQDITIYAQPELQAGAAIIAIQQCDDNNDGFYDFDLHTLKDAEALGLLTNASTANFRVRYFPTEADLDADTNEILANPYTNITPYNETLWVRIENVNHNDCYTKISFAIEIFEQPILPAGAIVNPIEQCDDNNDGFYDFDLHTLKDAEVLGLLTNASTANFQVRYFPTEADLDADTNEILNNPYTNVTINSETLWIRIENINHIACYEKISFTIIINPLPTLQAGVVLHQCDEDALPNDGFTNFNLNEANSELVTPTVDYTFTYFEDAALTTQIMPQDNYINTSNPQTIYAVVQNNTTLCSRSIAISLETSASQLDPNLMVNLEACDDDGTEDGFHLFDLQNADATILASLPVGQTYSISYYATLQDAQLEQNALPLTNYMSIAQSQDIYVRVDNAINNDCFGIGVHVNLLTNPLPQPILGNYFFCTNIGFVTLDATINDGNTYSYLWDTGETTASINATVAGDHTVTVTNTTTNCTNTAVAHVAESSAPDTIYIVAVDNSQNNSMEIIVTGIGDYEYSIDNGLAFYDSNYFDHLAPGFYDIVVRDKNGCGTITTMKALVGFPPFFTPNADGFNDFWKPKGILTPELVTIKIFDRYGKLLKTLRADSQGWDGLYNGVEMPSTDYWFYVKLPNPDGREFRSHFALKR